MNIIACIKEVPDTEASIQVGADKKTINETHVTYIMNPYDEYAVEAALKIQESKGGETTALTMGGERANEALRYAISMGVNKAIRLKSDKKIDDAFVMAKAMSEALGKMEYDLILLGKETIDDGSQQLGPMMGEFLGCPCITSVTKLDVSDTKVTAERETAGGIEVFEADLPCIITAQKGLNEPRYPSLRGKMTAKKAVIDELDIPAQPARTEILGLSAPPARGESKVVGEGIEAVPELIRLLREEAKVI
jgi:electron transfer flavoprotein beta subunit